MTVTCDRLKQLGMNVRQLRRFRDSTANKCGEINSFISIELREEAGVDHEFVQSKPVGNGEGTALHHYIVVKAGEVEGVNGPVIVDGAVDQFNQQNVEDDAVDVDLCLGGAKTADDLPTVGVFTPQDTPEFNWYQT